MNLPHLKKRIEEIEKKLKLYKPSRAPGVLTSITTRGTSRQAANTNTGNGGNSGPVVAVWG